MTRLLSGGTYLPDTDFQSNQGMIVTAAYFRYWGKADKPIKAAYCSGQPKEEIVTKFKSQLAKLISLPESRINVSHLDEWAETEDKSRGKGKWGYE